METCSVTPMWSTFGAMIAYLKTLKEKFFSNLLVPNVRRSNCLITNCARACFLIRANSPPIFFSILDQRLVTWYRDIFPRTNFTLPSTTKFLSPVQTDTTLLANLSQHCWMLHLASVCTPCCTLLRFVESCSPKLENGGTCKRTQQLSTLGPTMLHRFTRGFRRSVARLVSPITQLCLG